MNNPDNMTLQATVDQDGVKGSKIDRQTWSDRFAWLARILILMALVAAPWMLGSVEYWSQFWISSALLLALALWWFDTALNKRTSQVLPYLAILLVLGIFIGLFQLLPLSGAMADFFLGRQAELYQEFTQQFTDAESSELAARISLNANATWHQIRLLVIALSAMLLCCRYFRTPRSLAVFFTVMTANGAAISIFGIIQKLTSNGQQLFWSIPLTLGGQPFGPYVNRNNSAGFLLICLACAVGLMVLTMSAKKNTGPQPIISKEIPFWRQMSQQLLYFISELTAVKLAALIAIVFISAGIVASLSRGAVLGLLVTTTMAIISYGMAKKPKNLGIILLPLSMAVICLTCWLGFSSDLISRFDRVDSTREVEKWDLRVQTWKDTWPSVGEMGKLGSGLGTYDVVSRLYRTDKETKVFQYAENQYFQSLIEAGWPGFVIYLVAWAVAFYYAYFLLKLGQSPATVSAGMAGVFLLWGQAIASIFDFGFYIPANTLAMSCVIGVIAYYSHSMAYRLKQKSFLRFQFPNSFIQVILVVLFAAGTMVTLDLNRKSRIEALKSPVLLELDSLNYEQVDAKIKELTNLASNSQSLLAMNELGRLGVQRARLELFDLYKSEVILSDLDTEQIDRIWIETSLIRIHNRSENLRLESKLSQDRFLKLESIQVNLPFARHWFEQSLNMSPLQPEVQVVLGEITSILYGVESGRPFLERSIKIAPANAVLLRQVAVLYLQSGKFEYAAPHLKRYLALVPKDFDLMMQVTTTKMQQFNGASDFELMLNEMLPDVPQLLFEFANEYAEPDSLVQKIALEKAEIKLEEVSQSDPEVMILRARIRRAMGDIQASIDLFRSALINNPNDQVIRAELVNMLVAVERYDEALEPATELYRSNDRNRRYRAILDSIKLKLDEQKK